LEKESSPTFLRDLISKSIEPKQIQTYFKVVEDPTSVNKPDLLLNILNLDKKKRTGVRSCYLHVFELDAKSKT